MNRKQRINNLLVNQLKDYSIEIIDNSHLHKNHNGFNGKDETHIKIILINKNNFKLDRINLHRKINQILKNEFNQGLHSLEIKIN